MQNRLKTSIVIVLISFLMFSYSKILDTTNVKCMIQMTDYDGFGAYIIISLINPEGDYESTLFVQGKDKEWYNELSKWWRFYGKIRNNIDAITGETVSGGERTVSLIKIPNDRIDKGYSVRFESSVEDQKYYIEDIQFDLTSENINNKIEGSGFIHYIRMISN
jgi:hypothetical protein